MIKIDNIKLPVGADEGEVFDVCVKKSKITRSAVKHFKILKKSIDARDKERVFYVYSAEISDREESEERIVFDSVKSDKKVVVTGFGPAGIFCALYLARSGLKPIVIERGQSVKEREKSVYKFVNEGLLDTESNIQFGEGGAGAFSDGKLSTGVSGKFVRQVLVDFVDFGAPKEILIDAKPHVGSDRLPTVVSNIRKEIERLGGKVMFSTKLTGFKFSGEKLIGVKTDKGEIKADDVVLAIGHSARDTFDVLKNIEMDIEPKAFAVGVRIEHLQEDISVAQYGAKFAPLLPPADYRLATHGGGRGVFTFCMCPGGYVIPSASEEGGVVTNGMSLYKRDGKNANSALLCEVYPQDLGGDVFGGVDFQRKLERAAFEAGGKNYSAPVQLFGDFLSGKVSSRFKKVAPTYSVGTNFCDLNDLLPRVISDNLKFGVTDFGRKLKGFDTPDAVLTGIESRSSSPIRILRGDNFSAVGFSNIYPCGEGCGYAGGITSAAVDGIKVAGAIIEKYKGL